MTISLNKVTLQGTIGKDIEVKVVGTTTIGSFSVCTNKWIASKSENKAVWHSVKVFGKTCDGIQARCLKGNSIYLEGEIEYQEWNDKDSGTKKSKTEIIANMIRIENKKNDGGNSNGSGGSYSGGGSNNQEDSGYNGDENDLPF